MKEFLKMGWTWYPSVVIGSGLWTTLYLLALRRGKAAARVQQLAFHLGTLTGLVALISPLDELGDRYLFSAHMVQHLLLMFVTAPLWLVGTPVRMIEGLIPGRLTVLVRRATSPVPAFLAFAGVMWLWHVPLIFEMAQRSEALHIFEHLTYLGAALIGWWPVTGADSHRLPAPPRPVRMLYLFLLAIPCTALAAILTFARTPLYPFYVRAPHPFRLDALQDQHLGGLLMWLPTHAVLLLALGITFLKWFAESELRSENETLRTFPVEE